MQVAKGPADRTAIEDCFTEVCAQGKWGHIRKAITVRDVKTLQPQTRCQGGQVMNETAAREVEVRELGARRKRGYVLQVRAVVEIQVLQ
jgi:hypothetical protein